jgi:outer membrane protein OmpA-like peptidoglycan-associated protein
MKILSLSLLAFVAAAAFGCSPTYPPSEYGDAQVKPVAPSSDTTTALGPVNDAGAAQPQADSIPERDPKSGRGPTVNPDGTWDPAAVLATIYFGFDKYHVEVSERGKLDGLAKNARIIVAGYTDHFGTEQYNLSLSDKRAQSVKAYLAGIGIPEGNFEIQAFGRQYAKASGSRTEVAEDRKVVVVNADYRR